MKPRDYFPLGMAHGKAFCNRVAETQWLMKNIRACKHSLLIAPRRFGKSSLAEKAIADSGLPATSLNFNTCSDQEDVEALIRQGVSQLIGRALGPIDKIINSVKNYMGNLSPKISFGSEYASLELTTAKPATPASNVEEALMLLEKLLLEKKQSAVMLLDEFQIVGIIAKGTGVEAAIRNAAQSFKNLAIVFSGSSRSLLQSMFEDGRRPLYKLCRKLCLTRIEQTHYHAHINQAAYAAWGKQLDNAVFERIILLSELHPYYINYLCDVLWTECSCLPTVSDVDDAWYVVIDEERSDTHAEIANLSMGQKKILKYIANQSGENLMSSTVIQGTGMALSSIAGAITGLLEKDMIEKQEDSYKIINPIVGHLLRAG